MKVVKAIGFWLAYCAMVIIKLPFTLLVALTMGIELICMRALALLAKWHGSDTVARDLNSAFEATATASEFMSEKYLDLQIEL